MTTPSHNRAFQAYNNRSFQNKLEIKSNPTCQGKEPLVFGRIPYTSIKTTIESTTSTPSSPSPRGILKSTAVLPKRRTSISSINHLLPRRKSLQMTALASQRQSLWMNIAKNCQTNNSQLMPFPLRQDQTTLIRKKFLRLLLVFSYLLSISLFGIALVTFYGFFWTGYSTTGTSTKLPMVTIKSNTTIIDLDYSHKD